MKKRGRGRRLRRLRHRYGRSGAASTLYRIVTWTRSRGIQSVSDVMPRKEAERLAVTLRQANPSWLYVDVEPETQHIPQGTR